MFNNGGNPRGRAVTMASLRAVVAGYLIYLGGSLIYTHLKGTSDMKPWMCWFFGIFFILAGGAFGIYTWKRYKQEKDETPEEGGKAPEEIPMEGSGENEPEKPADDAPEQPAGDSVPGSPAERPEEKG